MKLNNESQGSMLRSAVRLMLISQFVMVTTILSQYFLSFYIAPLFATVLYLGLWSFERKVGVASPITRIMTVFYCLFTLARYYADDQSWLAYSSSAIYFVLAIVVFGLLFFGKPFTCFYSKGKGFMPLHKAMSIMWGGLHTLAGLSGYFLIPSIWFLYVPLGLMLFGAIGTLWMNFISMGPSFERKKKFEFGGLEFREVKTEEDVDTFYQVVAKSYRADLQKELGMRKKVDEKTIINEHVASDIKRKDEQVPFIVLENDKPIGSICIFFDHRKNGLPIEGEAGVELTNWRMHGGIAEVGRLGLIRSHRFNQTALKGLFKCIIEAAIERNIHYIFNDSFLFQMSLYKKIGFSKIVDEAYLSSDENSTGYGLKAIPMVMNLASMIKLEEETSTSNDVKGILSPYITERFFKRLAFKELFQNKKVISI